MAQGRTHLPVALNLEGRSAIVVGGGEPAYFKTCYLTDFGVETTVLAPPEGELDARIETLHRDGHIALSRARYAAARLDGHWLAVICTGDRSLDHRVAADARARGMLVNVVDDPGHCDFFASGYVRRGGVSIAINTGGASPAFSAALRERAGDLFGPEVEEHLGHYARWRAQVRASIGDAGQRERLWRALRAAGLYKVLREKGAAAGGALVKSHIEEFTARAAHGGPPVEPDRSA